MEEHEKIYRQKHLMSCPSASVKILLEVLGEENNIEEDILREFGYGGKTWFGMTAYQLNMVLHEVCTLYNYTYIQEDNIEIGKLLDHLESGGKCLVLYMVDRDKNPYNQGKNVNKNPYGLHWSVADSYHKQKRKITILNPFGYKEDYALQEFQARWSLENQYLNNTEKLLKKLHIVKPRTTFFISKK